MVDWVTASAPGRVCFGGEDLDWIVGPSVLCAVDLRVTVTVSEGKTKNLTINSSTPFDVQLDVPISDVIQHYRGSVLDYSQAAINVLAKHGFKIRPLEINISSTLPAKAGLSSSAAVTIATLMALSKLDNLSLSINDICHLGYEVESIELRTGAGQMDLYSSGLGGLIYIDSSVIPPVIIERHSFPSNYKIIVVDTKTPRSTAEVIKFKRERFADRESNIMTFVDHTFKAVQEMRTVISSREYDVDKLGTIISDCHVYLRDFMKVSTDLLNQCVDECLRLGAIGAKLTGTGMGGCMFAIVHETNVEIIRSKLAGFPVDFHVTNFSNDGVLINQFG